VPAALVAGVVRTALRACAPTAAGPAALLAGLERAVAPDVGPGCFVTVVAVLVSADGRTARVASAGHPPPLLVHDGRALAVALEAGLPVALEGEVLPRLDEVVVALPTGAALLLHTDGLTDRRSADAVSLVDPQVLATGLPADLELAADAVLTAAAAAGSAQDDVSLLLARPKRD
jgi:serine phosphatase RsbU (regulator of sigma subunit)